DGAADPELAAACAFARRRRLGPYRRSPAAADARERGRELAAFARAGVARHAAEAVLDCADAAAVAAPPADSRAARGALCHPGAGRDPPNHRSERRPVGPALRPDDD